MAWLSLEGAASLATTQPLLRLLPENGERNKMNRQGTM
jgi:hypothetical protein